MRVILKDKAKFYAVEEDGNWTFQRDGNNNYYRYPLNTFDYGSKITEYIKITPAARMYRADGMRVTDADVLVSMHKDDADEGDKIYEKYTGVDYNAMIWVDEVSGSSDPVPVYEGDYIEVDIIGFDDAVGLAIMNSSVTPEPTPPTPTPTVEFEIVEGTRNFSSEFFDNGPECPAGMNLYPIGWYEPEDEEEFSGVWVFWDDAGWRPDYKLNTIYDAMTVSGIQAIMQDGDGETSYHYAWLAITPPADSGNSGSDDEDDDEGDGGEE